MNVKRRSASFYLIVFSIISVIILRVMPWRIPGFSSVFAIIILSGFYFRQKGQALLLPALILFLSDVIYEVLFRLGWGAYPGFYGYSQWINYAFLLVLIIVPILLKKSSFKNIVLSSLLAPTIYFLLSNLSVFFLGGGLHRPRNMYGMLMTLADGIPFYLLSVLSTFLFCGLFYAFSVYYLKHHYSRLKS